MPKLRGISCGDAEEEEQDEDEKEEEEHSESQSERDSRDSECSVAFSQLSMEEDEVDSASAQVCQLVLPCQAAPRSMSLPAVPPCRVGYSMV